MRPKRFKSKTGVGARYGRRHVPGQMNQTESRYADLLQAEKLLGNVVEWHFEGITFKLGSDLRYTPDFVVFQTDGTLSCIDVKGSGPIDAKSVVKIKAAAEKYYWFAWLQAIERTKKEGGGFALQEF